MLFTVEPTSVPFSTGDAQSIVDLTVTVTNDGATAAVCSQVVLTIPYSQSTTAITADPSTIATSPGDSTPWAVYSDGAGTVFALPLPPTTGLAAGESAVFVLGAVVVNTAEGTATIDIVADVVGSPVTGRVDVRKDRPAHVGDGQPGRNRP